MYHLAEHLGQPLSTVLEMTADEYNHWFTYLNIKAERQKNDGKYRRRSPSRLRGKRQR